MFSIELPRRLNIYKCSNDTITINETRNLFFLYKNKDQQTSAAS